MNERNAIDARVRRSSESPRTAGFRKAGFELHYYRGPWPVLPPCTWQTVSARSMIANGFHVGSVRDEVLGIAGQVAVLASEAGLPGVASTGARAEERDEAAAREARGGRARRRLMRRSRCRVRD
jgi:hypothetical protein